MAVSPLLSVDELQVELSYVEADLERLGRTQAVSSEAFARQADLHLKLTVEKAELLKAIDERSEA